MTSMTGLVSGVGSGVGVSSCSQINESHSPSLRCPLPHSIHHSSAAQLLHANRSHHPRVSQFHPTHSSSLGYSASWHRRLKVTGVSIKRRCPSVGVLSSHAEGRREFGKRIIRSRRVRSSLGSEQASEDSEASLPPSLVPPKREPGKASTLLRRFWDVAAPYWSSEDKGQARTRLVAVFVFSLGCTGVSVLFNFLGRDFYNALESKNEELFFNQILWYLAAFVGGIPVFVLRDYLRDTLSLRWRAWMTSDFLKRYMSNRTFYAIQAQMLVDNPDQRMNDDVRVFTETALVFSLALFSALIDLISFSGILYSIYPPLFGVLLAYSIGGTAISVALGKNLVGLNFLQEKKEADFRYGLVRVRENAESIAFYGGEQSEIQLLMRRFRESFANYSQLLLVGRNLEFFTSFYRYLIQLLPAAVVAPLFFRGEIEFGVINQSFSAFNHVLADCSIIVYRFQSLTEFSAIVERLGEFNEVLNRGKTAAAPEEPEQRMVEDKRGASDGQASAEAEAKAEAPLGTPQSTSQSISIRNVSYASSQSGMSSSSCSGGGSGGSGPVLLELQNVTLLTPLSSSCIVKGLSLSVHQGEHLLIVGRSGAGKTSLLRAIAGLWRTGTGTVVRHVVLAEGTESPDRDGSARQLDVDKVSLREPLLEEDGIPEAEHLQTNSNGASAASSASASAASASSSAVSSASPPSAATSGSGSAGGERGDSSEREGDAGEGDAGEGDAGGLIFFVPQRPYMVLGTLRQQLLYPTWGAPSSPSLVSSQNKAPSDNGTLVSSQGLPLPSLNEGVSGTRMDVGDGGGFKMPKLPFSLTSPLAAMQGAADKWQHNAAHSTTPNDEQLLEVLKKVRLGYLADRWEGGLDADCEWSSTLSLGEQQRIAFARLLLSRPLLALMDESTSALDEESEAALYEAVEAAGVTFVSVAHRKSLVRFHNRVLKLQPNGVELETMTEDGLCPAVSWTVEQLASMSTPST